MLQSSPQTALFLFLCHTYPHNPNFTLPLHSFRGFWWRETVKIYGNNDKN